MNRSQQINSSAANSRPRVSNLDEHLEWFNAVNMCYALTQLSCDGQLFS